MYENTDASNIRADIRETLDRWAQQQQPHLGDFMRAVLENNLREAFGRADSDNFQAMAAIVRYCYEKLPAESWGSVAAVRKWLEASNKKLKADMAARRARDTKKPIKYMLIIEGKPETRSSAQQLELEEIQALVGGYVESKTLFFARDGRAIQLIMDEDGKAKQLAPNFELPWIGDVILGPVLIIAVDERLGDQVDLDDKLWSHLLLTTPEGQMPRMEVVL